MMTILLPLFKVFRYQELSEISETQKGPLKKIYLETKGFLTLFSEAPLYVSPQKFCTQEICGDTKFPKHQKLPDLSKEPLCNFSVGTMILWNKKIPTTFGKILLWLTEALAPAREAAWTLTCPQFVLVFVHKLSNSGIVNSAVQFFSGNCECHATFVLQIYNPLLQLICEVSLKIYRFVLELTKLCTSWFYVSWNLYTILIPFVPQ